MQKNPITHRLRSDNSTGFKGVTEGSKGFVARIQTQVGTIPDRVVFDVFRAVRATPIAAALAYDNAVRDLFPDEPDAVYNRPRIGERGLDGVRRTA